MNEDLIIDEIKSGNHKELALVYRTYRSEFIAWITSQYSCSKDEAREAYQISILVLYENIVNNKLQTLHSSLKTYLFSIGKNKFLELKKKENRYSHSSLELDYGLAEIETIEEEDREKNLQLVESSLDKLGDPCRSLLKLYYFKGKSMDEIAEEMNYKNGATAKNLKYKCLARLRDIFKDEKKNNL